MTGLLRGRLKVFLLIVTMFALMAAVACQGDRGPAGVPGAAGNPGNSGEPGNPGEPGEPGNPGEPGAAGESGNPGEPGAPGKPGSPGNPGNTGPTGDAGATGATGAAGKDGTTRIAGVIVTDANGTATGIIGATGGSATVTFIGGGFAKGERLSVAVRKGGNDILLTGTLGSRDNTSDLAANDNGGFSLTVDLEGYPVGEVITVSVTGDKGNRGSAAFMLVDK